MTFDKIVTVLVVVLSLLVLALMAISSEGFLVNNPVYKAF